MYVVLRTDSTGYGICGDIYGVRAGLLLAALSSSQRYTTTGKGMLEYAYVASM